MYLDSFDKLFLYNNNIRDAAIGVQIYNKNDHSINDILIAGNIIHDLGTTEGRAFSFQSASEMIVVANFFYNIKMISLI